jgi:putative ABC transport system permease protein
LSEVRVDAEALAWTVMIAMTTGILFGLLPALEASRPDLQGNLREGARGMAGSRRKTRMQGALIVSEVALAVVLLTGACLLLRSFVRLQQVDPGFRTENVVTMQIVLPRARYGQVQRSWAFYSQVLERVRVLPGVLQASAVSEIPLSGRAEIDSFEAEGTPADPAKNMLANFHVVAGDYFPSLAIPILQGRAVGTQESREELRVAVISEASAREFWPGRDAIGRRVRMGPRSPWLTVVGVAGNLRHTALSGRERPEVYIPYAQMDYTQDMNLVVRTAADPASLTSAIRAQVWAVDRDQPVDHVRTMQQIVADSTSVRRFSTLLVAAFAGLAMVLAAIGIYGVISYSVTQRKHEFGVRLALGAARRDVLRMVLRQGLGLVSIGVCVGIVSALALTRFLTGLLYGVAALDPLTYVAVPLILIAVALAACVVPAVRAMEVNPVVALRCD